jgi:RNA polymerase sigma factor (sigma-70 family)
MSKPAPHHLAPFAPDRGAGKQLGPHRSQRLQGRLPPLYDGLTNLHVGRIRHQRPTQWSANILGNQRKASMNDAPSDPQNPAAPAATSIAAVLINQRGRIINFLRLRGAGDAAEDVYQELWMRLAHREQDSIADPSSYVMRAANNLMLDRYRSNRQRELRDTAWGELRATTEASAENRVIAQQQLQLIERAIEKLGTRPAQIFRRFRLDGIPQREIAAELSVSLSTVEADLRKAYAAIAATRRQFDAP